MHRSSTSTFLVAASLLTVACDEPEQPTAITPASAVLAQVSTTAAFTFTPIVPFTGAAACLNPAVPQPQPLQLPSGFGQTIIGRQSDLVTTSSEVNFDMLTLNETGPQAGRYLYRTHEVGPFAALSRIDLQTGTSQLVAERADWESFDGLVWTP